MLALLVTVANLYIIATHIAISEYYKTRNGFYDSRGYQEAGCEEKFVIKNCNLG